MIFSKKLEPFVYINIAFLLFLIIAPTSAANIHNSTGVAIYLLDKQEELPLDTRKYWSKIKFSYASIHDCDINNENLKSCLIDDVKQIIKEKKYPKNVVIITDVTSHNVINLFQDESLNKLISLFIYYKPGSIDKNYIKANSHNTPAIFLTSKNDDKKITRLTINSANYLKDHGYNIWTTWLTPYPDKKKSKGSILSPQLIFLASNVFGILNGKYQEFLTAERIWENPSFSDPEYFIETKFIFEDQVNERFLNTLRSFLSQTPYQLDEYELKRYTYFDVLSYLNKDQSLQEMQYLIFENRKGRVFEIDLAKYIEFNPVIVIAIDDNKNLHSIAKFYRTKKSYSWIAENKPRPLFVDTLGPFLYFKKEVPIELQLPLWQYGQILFDKIKIQKQSQLNYLKFQSIKLGSIIQNNCISCHKISGIGGKAHHINAITLTKEPGFGLPLEDYQIDVMKSFLYEQNKVAFEIGVTPNPVEKDTAEDLLNFLY